MFLLYHYYRVGGPPTAYQGAIKRVDMGLPRAASQGRHEL